MPGITRGIGSKCRYPCSVFVNPLSRKGVTGRKVEALHFSHAVPSFHGNLLSELHYTSTTTGGGRQGTSATSRMDVALVLCNSYSSKDGVTWY